MEFLNDATVWVAFSFAGFLAILWFKARRAILAKLDGQIAAIRAEIQTAEQLKAEAADLLSEYERKLKDARAEAQRLLSQAEANAAQMKKEGLAALDEAAARREAQLAERVQRMKQSAMADIQTYAADLAIQATREIIVQNLDQAAQKRLLDHSIRAAGEKLN